MSNLEPSIAEWRQQMAAGGFTSPEVLAELESHLRERIGQLAPAMPLQQAFQTATQELGESEILMQEFVKVGNPSVLSWRENHMALNLVGAWLMLAGLNAVSQIVWLAILRTPSEFPALSYWIVALYCLLFALQLPAGIGLLRRKRHWRACSFLFLTLKALIVVYSLCVLVLKYHGTGWQSHGRNLILVGMPVPMSVVWITHPINLVMSLFALYVLTRPDIRNLFRPASVSQVA
jgi:uncharacterized membrane protein